MKLVLDITDIEFGHLLFALESKAKEYKELKDEETSDEYTSLYYHVDRQARNAKMELKVELV